MFLTVTLVISIIFAFTIKQEAQIGIQKETATPVRKGVMTNRQREHSKLYSDRRVNSRKLTDFRGDEAQGEVNVTSGQEYGSFDFSARPTPNEYIRDQACDADLIIFGKATAKESQLTPEETYIFTDYTFSVDKLLKDDRSQYLGSLKESVVTRGGGRVKLDGREITFNDNSFKRILIGGNYLLFLKRISETGAYRTIDGSTVADSNGKLQTLSDPHKGEVLQGLTLDAAIDLIEAYVASYKCSSNEVR